MNERLEDHGRRRDGGLAVADLRVACADGNVGNALSFGEVKARRGAFHLGRLGREVRPVLDCQGEERLGRRLPKRLGHLVAKCTGVEVELFNRRTHANQEDKIRFGLGEGLLRGIHCLLRLEHVRLGACNVRLGDCARFVAQVDQLKGLRGLARRLAREVERQRRNRTLRELLLQLKCERALGVAARQSRTSSAAFAARTRRRRLPIT